jgi:hypothetical protein
VVLLLIGLSQDRFAVRIDDRFPGCELPLSDAEKAIAFSWIIGAAKQIELPVAVVVGEQRA